MSERALPEFAPFAATLAQRLTKLVGAGQLAPNQPLWELAVDRFLVLAVDTEGQVQHIIIPEDSTPTVWRPKSYGLRTSAILKNLSIEQQQGISMV